MLKYIVCYQVFWVVSLLIDQCKSIILLLRLKESATQKIGNTHVVI